MHLLKLPWLGHRTENKNVECYSVSLNSDGSRLASGGLDGNVKIWDTKAILSFIDYDDDQVKSLNKANASLESIHKRALCSMSRHNGVVTCVKFSPDGRFLASGSDDKIVLIWEKDDDAARPMQFGEAEADLEHWTVRKRLVAHENDIQDICWSPDGNLLVTVGLDRSIIIWSGTTFERIKRYNIHQSMVKGIVFDPANKYFATASDDRTVRVFRYHRKLSESSYNSYEFQMEHIILDPFKKSPLTSYFRRMSWSPDGQHIAVPNATNGPVTSISIINRGDWTTNISLIGHEAPTEVCSFSPKLFESSVEQANSTEESSKIHTILATGGQDRTLVVWSTARTKPLLVAESITSGSITDICWSPEGEILFLSSLDGTISCIKFDPMELGKVISDELTEQQLNRYGADRESATFPEGVSQLLLEKSTRKQEETKMTIPTRISTSTDISMAEKQSPQLISSNSLDISATQAQLSNLKKAKLAATITSSGKRRITPLLISSSKNKVISSGVTKLYPSKKNNKVSSGTFSFPRTGIQTLVHGNKHKDFVLGEKRLSEKTDELDNDNVDMGIDDFGKDVSNQNISGTSLRRNRLKLKKEILLARYPSSFQAVSRLPSILFCDHSVLSHKLNSLLRSGYASFNKEAFELSAHAGIESIDENLMFNVIIKGIRSVRNDSLLYNQTDAPFNEDADSGHNLNFYVEIRNAVSWSHVDELFDSTSLHDDLDFQDPTTAIISYTCGKKRNYTINFPYKIQHMVPLFLGGSVNYFAFVSYGGIVSIFHAPSGQLYAPPINLSHNVISIIQGGPYIMCLTSQGLIYVWKLEHSCFSNKMKGTIKGISVAPVLNYTLQVNLEETTDPNLKKNVIPSQYLTKELSHMYVNSKDGSPILMLKDREDIYKYDVELQSWVKVVDSWFYLGVPDEVLASYQEDTSMPLCVRTSIQSFMYRVSKSELVSYTFSEGQENLEQYMKDKFFEQMKHSKEHLE